jgi:S-adenosylmethionine synthetase
MAEGVHGTQASTFPDGGAREDPTRRQHARRCRSRYACAEVQVCLDPEEVGRGNRANGLIAFSRPTGGEAAAGKNPVAHTGKIYSVLSRRLAQLIHTRLPELPQVQVHRASRIGEPVDRPWTGVQVILPDGCALSDVDGAIREVVEVEIDRLPQFHSELIRGAHPVF